MTKLILPPKAEKTPLVVNMSPEERALVKAAAKENGCTMTAVVRSLIRTLSQKGSR